MEVEVVRDIEQEESNKIEIANEFVGILADIMQYCTTYGWEQFNTAGLKQNNCRHIMNRIYNNGYKLLKIRSNIENCTYGENIYKVCKGIGLDNNNGSSEVPSDIDINMKPAETKTEKDDFILSKLSDVENKLNSVMDLLEKIKFNTENEFSPIKMSEKILNAKSLNDNLSDIFKEAVKEICLIKTGSVDKVTLQKVYKEVFDKIKELYNIDVHVLQLINVRQVNSDRISKGLRPFDIVTEKNKVTSKTAILDRLGLLPQAITIADNIKYELSIEGELESDKE